jgi:pimeloyl-ACP methyl ester carboxylesterase
VSNTPHHAVAYILANAGYDVFLGNTRGNFYSSKHVSLDPKRDAQEFFNYSFQEQGDHDVPTQINLALAVSGAQKLSYIGHSQGTTQMFYALATNQNKIAPKLNLFIALAPVVTFKENPYAKTYTPLTSILDKPFRKWMEDKHIYSITKEDLFHKLDFAFVGFNFGSFLESLFDIVEGSVDFNDNKWMHVCSHWMNTRASVKQILHFKQIAEKKQFQMFDTKDGWKNQVLYNSEKPPVIDLTKINQVPVAHFVGLEDPLVYYKDSRWVKDQIPSSIYYREF